MRKSNFLLNRLISQILSTMAPLQGSRVIQVLLFSSIVCLCAHAVSLSSLLKHVHMERQKEPSFVFQSNASSCSKVCISGFEEVNCQNIATPNGTIPEYLTATIKNTAGILTPLIWLGSPAPNVQIKSLSYFRPTTENTTNCKPIQFMFYNEQHQDAGVAYLTPGQSGHGCVTFYSENVVSYNRVTMLVSVPNGITGVGQ